MKIKVKLFATLQNGRFNEKDLNINSVFRVMDVLKEVNISNEEAAIIFVNGKHSLIDTELKDGDVVSVFPPIGGG